MKEITYNYDDVDENEINRIVRRAKAVIVNDKDEILLVLSHQNYYLVGGHVENSESDFECLEREIKEETGVDIEVKPMKPYFRIKYLNRDYPKEGVNTLSLANYYIVKANLKPVKKNRNLTESEKAGGFKTDYIPVNEALPILIDSLSTSTREGAVLDTIEALKEYINITNE